MTLISYLYFKSSDIITCLQREIEQTDAMIDALVYELYGLSEEEIQVVEGIL